MPLTALDVDGETSKSANWGYTGGSTNFTNLQLPDDDATTFMQSTGTGNGEAVFTMDDLPAAAAIVVDVTSRYRAQKASGSDLTIHTEFRRGGDTVSASTRLITVGTYANYDDAFATAPDTGTWTIADVNNSSIIIEKTVGANGQLNVTTLVARVNWLGFQQSQSFLLAQWLPPLLGFYGLMKREIVFLLRNLKTIPSNAEDFAWIEAALGRRPVYAGNHF